MAADDIIVGLDIGTSKICAVIAELDENGRLEVLGVGQSVSRGLRRGIVINIEATLKSVIEAVEAAEMMSGREVASVVTGIAGAHIEGINSRGVVAVTSKTREINEHDIDRVLDAAKAIVIPMDREVLHVIPQEYLVDGQGGVKTPIDMIGVRLEAEVHIVTGSVTAAQNLIKCVNRAGFRVDDLVLQSLAAGRAVLSRDEKELGVLLIDLGGGTTDVLLYQNGAPYFTAVLPVGGSQVTGDLSFMLKIPMDEAERLKLQDGCCYMPLIDDNETVLIPGVGGRPPVELQKKGLCQIIQPRMAEILRMVKDKIAQAGFLDKIGGGIVLTGGGAHLPGVMELAQAIFGGGNVARIGTPMGVGGLVQELQNSEYAAAVGLIQYASEQGVISSSEKQGDKNGSMLKSIGSWFKNFFE